MTSDGTFDHWTVEYPRGSPTGRSARRLSTSAAVRALLLGGIIFGIEVAIMLAFVRGRFPDEPWVALIDAGLLVAITLPLVHMLAYRPLLRAEAHVAQLASIIESAGDAVVGKRLDGTVTSWNRASERLYGYSADEIVGRSISILFPPELEAAEMALLTECLRRGDPWEDYETTRMHKDGRRIPVALTMSPIRDARGVIIGASTIARDITRRKQAEAAAVESHNLVDALIQGTDDAIFIKDVQGRYLFLNPAGARFLGRSVAEVIGERDSDLFSPESARTISERDRAVMTSGQSRTEDVLGTAAGKIRTYTASVGPFRDAEGRVCGVFGIARDITERKRADERMQFLAEASATIASSLDYETTLARVAELAVPRLAEGCIVDVLDDDGSVRLVGTALKDPEHLETFRAIARRSPTPGAPRWHVVRTGQPVMGEVTDELLVMLARGVTTVERLRTFRFLFYLVVPLMLRERVLGTLTFATTQPDGRYQPADVAFAEQLAARAAAAIENARLYRIAQQSSRAREDLLAVVSHDLKSPLSAIMMGAESLGRITQSGETSDRVRDTGQQILRSAKRMDVLIRDLLDAAAVEAGSFPVNRARHATGALVDEAVDLVAPMARDRGLRLERRIAAALPDVDCDRERAIQVFSNLIGNAIKFTSEGGSITVSADREGEMVRFAVSDSGTGIPEEALSHLFDRYWQASRAGRAGSGLGLYIVKGIVEAHGGKTWASSVHGVGSTFSFTLPVAK